MVLNGKGLLSHKFHHGVKYLVIVSAKGYAWTFPLAQLISLVKHNMGDILTCQLRVVSCELISVSCQLSVDICQLRVDIRQLCVASWKLIIVMFSIVMD